MGDHIFSEMKTPVTEAPARMQRAPQADATMPTLYVPDSYLYNYIVADGWKDLKFANKGEHGYLTKTGKYGDGWFILWSDGMLTVSADKGLSENDNFDYGFTAAEKNSIVAADFKGNMETLYAHCDGFYYLK